MPRLMKTSLFSEVSILPWHLFAGHCGTCLFGIVGTPWEAQPRAIDRLRDKLLNALEGDHLLVKLVDVEIVHQNMNEHLSVLEGQS